MGIGKNPHRPEGKADTDNPHMQAAWQNEGPPHDAARNDKAKADADRARLRRLQGEPEDGAVVHDDQELIAGQRPGVESRVRNALERREEREAEPGEREEEAAG